MFAVLCVYDCRSIHPVYKALIEIGRANKSIFLCEYLEKEELRIEINEGLNVVERMNNVMDFIFYGKLGEMKTNKTEDQELSVWKHLSYGY